MRIAVGATPLKSGLATISQGRVSQWACRGAGVCQARLRGSVRIDADAEDYNGRMLLICGTADPKVVGVCSALLHPGDVFLDIGANYGTIGLMCANVVGPAGAVHLYEPQSVLCDRITRAASGAGLTWCTVHPYGLLDRDDRLTLNVNAVHTGAASFVRGTSDQGPVLEVRDVRREVAQATNGRPFGVKMDVEGAETRLFPGLAESPGLRFIVFECTDDQVRACAWKHAKERGWRLFGLRREAFRSRVEEICSLEALADHHDILAVCERLGLPAGWTGHPRELAQRLVRG